MRAIRRVSCDLTGGQIILSAADIRNIGGIVDHAVCVIDRQERGLENLEEHKIRLISLFQAGDLIPEREASIRKDGQTW